MLFQKKVNFKQARPILLLAFNRHMLLVIFALLTFAPMSAISFIMKAHAASPITSAK